MTSTNPLTSSGSIVSIFRNNRSLTKERLGQRVLPSDEGGYNRIESREAFIEKMRATPNLWGSKPAGKGYLVKISQGYVSVFYRDGTLSNFYLFQKRAKKKQVISEALRQIKHLPGCYIEIKYI